MDLYQNTIEKPAKWPTTTPAETAILLPPEQISTQGSAESLKNEQNVIIRLAASIQKYGILEPLSVKPAQASNGFPTYELIDGERRYRAALLAKVAQLPCVILAPNSPKCIQMAAISRLKCEKQHFFALAEAFLELITVYHMTQEEIARRMGLSQSAVANKLRLLRLLPEERRLIATSGLTERHARAFLRISDPAKRLELIAMAQREGQSVAATEASIDRYLAERARHESARQNPENAPVSPENGSKTAFLPPKTSFSPPNPPQGASNGELPTSVGARQSEARSAGITPNKFVLRDLKPLYTSIERTLGIFQKTGVAAEYQREEDENYAHIFIRIPKRG